MYNITIYRNKIPFLYFFNWSAEGASAITNLFSAQGFNVEVVDS
jgi:hypothetical protein